MSPVKVFGSAALVCLEEVGAEYDVVDVDFHAKEHKGAEHLDRNVTTCISAQFLPARGVYAIAIDNLVYLLLFQSQPFGQVPAFQDGDLMLFRKFRAPFHKLTNFIFF
ncbi:hypothetical protein SETIT_5G170900v2 [Setaria italica]|uniref:GST N-terminal domain-containing protein n=1 Tax=Setaria italica TaxID=4555 RepID=A0A368R5K3_SETIT|nr:hypothetical protein SETIT_5G170900v2 [Setaria italica]